MEPVYAIINEKERDNFEKKWFIPYGYFNCELFTNLDEAIEVYEMVYTKMDRENHVIEKVVYGEREVIYWS